MGGIEYNLQRQASCLPDSHSERFSVLHELAKAHVHIRHGCWIPKVIIFN